VFDATVDSDHLICLAWFLLFSLIASESSLGVLNQWLETKGKEILPMARFRPNIVITGTEPFAEDRMKVVKIGDTILHVVSSCPRCKESCTDQTTGEVTKEPVETLSDFRRMSAAFPDNVYFAVNAIPVTGSGTKQTISIGDKVEVLQWGKPVWGAG
jgi:uncharacterized protein YcbX